MAAGGDIKSIRNIWVKDNDGEVIKNAIRPLVDINRLPYIDYDIFEPSRMCRPMQGALKIMLHVEAQRGCPFDCTYCEAPSIRKLYESNGYKNYYRQKTPERLIAELEFLVNKYRPNYINFGAESFLAVSTPTLRKLADLYIEKIGLPFWCQSRPETVTEEKIKILKEMNCSDLQFGIEHGNEQFRADMLNRHVSNKKIIESLKLVEKYQIPYTVNNIIGFPRETRELVFDTIHLNRHFHPKSINCYMFTPYRGTWLRQYCVENGLLDKDATTMQSLDGADLKHDNITKEELYGLQRTFSLYARFPEQDFETIKLAEKKDEVGNKAFEELSKQYYEKYFK